MTEQTTVEWVCATYPARIKALFEALDLERAGLQDVKAALARVDSVGACKALLEYYRTCQSGKWLRWEKSPPPAAFNWTTAPVKGQEKPHLQGWYSPKYNQWEPNTTAVMTANVAGPTAFAWLLLPGAARLARSAVRLSKTLPTPSASGSSYPASGR